MSVAISSACWSLQLPPGPKFVLMALADFANEDGLCWPAVATLCERTGFSERAVQGHLKALEQAGAVTRQDGRGRSTVYRIQVEQAPVKAVDTPAESAPQPRRICTPPPQNLRGSPAESAPDPSLNHQGSKKEGEVRASRLPANWEPPVDDWEWAGQVLGPRRAREFEKFRDYWLAAPGQKGRKANWPATWRNWVRRASEDSSRSSGRLSAVDRVKAACREWENGIGVLDPDGGDVWPQVDKPAGRQADGVVVEGNFRLVG